MVPDQAADRRNDAKRGALFTKLTREIITAARQAGGDTDANYRLRMAVDKARANSMPAEFEGP